MCVFLSNSLFRPHIHLIRTPALRIDWCRSRARAMRWSEEVLLLCEEMRRVQMFLEWHARWWENQTHRLPNLSLEDAEGVVAYACKQAFIKRALARKFNDLWRKESGRLTVGAGADHDVLELEEETTSLITTYPTSPLDSAMFDFITL